MNDDSKGNEERSVVQSVGSAPAIAATDAVAFYDPEDGRVVHMHHIVTFEGAERQDRQRQRDNAVESARQLGHDVAILESLHVADFRPSDQQLRVDVEKRQLVEVPRAPESVERGS